MNKKKKAKGKGKKERQALEYAHLYLNSAMISPAKSPHVIGLKCDVNCKAILRAFVQEMYSKAIHGMKFILRQRNNHIDCLTYVFAFESA